MMMWKRIRVGMVGVFASASLVCMTSCLDDDSQPSQPDAVAFVSLFNASPDAPDLDIVVDNRQINSNPFEYADYTGYLRFFTGERNLKFGPFGASNIVVDTTVTFEVGKAYSVFVVDEYSDAGIIVLNDNSEDPASGKAKIRLVNLSPDTPDATLKVDGETSAVVEPQPFKEASDFIEVDAKTYDFKVTSDNGSEVVLDVPDVDLQTGWFYTIIVRGYKTPPAGNTNVASAQVIVN